MEKKSVLFVNKKDIEKLKKQAKFFSDMYREFIFLKRVFNDFLKHKDLMEEWEKYYARRKDEYNNIFEFKKN